MELANHIAIDNPVRIVKAMGLHTSATSRDAGRGQTFTNWANDSVSSDTESRYGDAGEIPSTFSALVSAVREISLAAQKPGTAAPSRPAANFGGWAQASTIPAASAASSTSKDSRAPRVTSVPETIVTWMISGVPSLPFCVMS